jgi:hypothetical protein
MKFSAGPASFYETAVFDPISMLVSAGTTLVGGLMSSNAASDAADVQAGAANRAADMSMEQYRQTREDLAPYRGYGTVAGADMMNRLTQLSSPFNPTQASLEATPGYQFALKQGLNATQNAAAAKGLGISGAALKGAAQFATGLADQTYRTAFDIDQANKTNSFNKLLETMKVGANASAQTGQLGVQSAQNAGANLSAGANAAASGIVGGNNAMVGGLNNLANSYQSYALINRLTANPDAAKAVAALGAWR